MFTKTQRFYITCPLQHAWPLCITSHIWTKTFQQQCYISILFLLCTSTDKASYFTWFSPTIFCTVYELKNAWCSNGSITLQQRNYGTATLPLQRNCYILCVRVNLKSCHQFWLFFHFFCVQTLFWVQFFNLPLHFQNCSGNVALLKCR